MNEIRVLKKMHLSTDLAAGRVAVVAPEGHSYAVGVERVCDCLRGISGVRPLVITEKRSGAAGLPPPRVPRLPAECRAAVVLGNTVDSSCMRDLYGRRYVFADRLYPGDGGRVVRSVHNPNGDGRNFIALAGSTDSGVSAAVARFVELVENSPMQGHIIDVVSDCVPKEAPKDLGARIDHAVDDILVNGRPSAAIDPILGAGYMYCLSGDRGWAEGWRDGVSRRLDEIIGDTAGKSTGRAEFWGWQLIQQWDLLEESDAFDDRLRLSLTNRVFDITARAARISYMRRENLPEGQVRWNHQTFNALACLFGGLYFRKYYHRPEAEEWLYLARRCFDGMLGAGRSWDEAGGYGAITPLHVLIYGLNAPDSSYLDSIDIGSFAERAFVHRDPMAALVNHGDGGGWSGREGTPPIGFTELYWEAAAALRGDGRYRWMLKRSNAARTRYTQAVSDLVRLRSELSSPAFAADIEPVAPRDHVGMTLLAPLDRKVYDAERLGSGVGWSRSVDKIAFREGLRTDSAYLLWDGFAGGRHGHQDANAIVRLSDRGRVWLADGGYNAESTARYHNGLLVVRNGRLADMPPLCRLDAVADLGSTMLGILTLPGYGGVDWTRCIVRRKHGYFLVLDSVTADVAGEYDLRLSWRWLGEARPTEEGLVVSQRGVCAVQATNQPEGALRDEKRYFCGRFPVWDGYPYADPVVRHFEQRRIIGPSGTREVLWATLIATSRDGEREGFRVDSRGRSVRIRTPAARAVAGFGSLVRPDIVTTGRMYLLEERGVWVVADAAAVRFGDLALSSDAPVSVEVDWSKERVTVCSSGAAHVTIENGGRVVRRRRVGAGRHAFRVAGIRAPEFPETCETRGSSTVGGRAVRRGGVDKSEQVGRVTGDAAVQARRRPAALRVERRAGPGSAVTAIRATGNAVVCGTADGAVHLFDPELRPRWIVRPGGAVNDLLLRVDSGGALVDVVSAHDDRMVRCFAAAGDERWTYRCPNGELATIGRAKLLRGADVNGDGVEEILTATASWWVVCLDSNGAELWRTRCYAHTALALETGVRDGGKTGVIVQSNEYYYLHAISFAGELLAGRYVGRWAPRVFPVVTVDLDGDGRDEIVCGASDAVVRAFELVEEGGPGRGPGLPLGFEELWSRSTGGEITALAVVPAPGGGPLIVAGSEGYRLTAIGPAGEDVWEFDIGFPAQGIFPVDDDLLIVGTSRVLRVSRKGVPRRVFVAPTVITAARPVCGALVLGFADGTIGRCAT